MESNPSSPKHHKKLFIDNTETIMLISIPLQTDSQNSFPTENLELYRGTNRDDNCVIVIGDRQIEVNMDELKKAIGIL